MLSTNDPLLLDIFVLVAVCVVSLLSIFSTWYVVRKANKELPTKNHVSRLQIDIQDAYGRLEDLSERFTRFQKKEGLRVAREEKKTQADLVAEAQALQAQATGDIENKTLSPKRELYKRAFRQ